jgi:hypothetical protein
MQGIYSMPIVSSGADMAARYPRGTEVACMGFLACYGDPYWAKFAGVSITASIEPGQEDAQTGAAEGCEKLEQHPQVLDLLRKRGVQAIVARFNEMRPCSAAWQPLGKSGGFFYLPLSTGAASE